MFLSACLQEVQDYLTGVIDHSDKIQLTAPELLLPTVRPLTMVPEAPAISPVPVLQHETWQTHE